MTPVTESPFSTEPRGHFIAGEWLRQGALRDSIDPATDEVLGQFFDADADVAQQAIDAASRAFEETEWRRNRELRASVLWAVADRVERGLDRLALAISLENGKPLGQAQFELSIAAPKLRYYAGLALTDSGTAAQVYDGATSLLLREPAGPAAVIVPWNSPGILSIRSIAPALAAGCTVAVKMPAQTGLTSALIAELFEGIDGLPAGVVNFFTESGDAGAKALVESPKTPVISYTGSTAVGAKIAEAAGRELKRTSLELGGKTPMIVFADADLDAVVPTLTAGITVFAGQFCMTGSRILVQRSIATELKRRLIASLEAVRIGHGVDPQTEMGPLIDHAAVERIDAFLAEHADPSRIVLRGGRLEGPGAFYRPVLVEVQDVESPLIQQEIFGPVATLEMFDDEADAVARANATRYGLAASVWTADGGRSLRVSSAIDAGTVWTNAWAQILDQFEEGGMKHSGVGRLNGPGGLAEFQEVKHIYRSHA